jgi:hypothetical protein
MDTREGGLLRWQWTLYPAGHRDRRNLALHAITEPFFLLGTCALLGSPLAGWRAAAGGAAGMIVALVAQGRGHKLESAAPSPFLGPLDVVRRFFAEQWITFPRYVLSGGFAAAWRDAK